MMPPEIMRDIASWRERSTEIISFSGTATKNPVVGFGVVGINTLKYRFEGCGEMPDGTSLVKNPTLYKPVRGNSTNTTFWNVSLSGTVNACTSCLMPEYTGFKSGIFNATLSVMCKKRCKKKNLKTAPVIKISNNTKMNSECGMACKYNGSRRYKGASQLLSNRKKKVNTATVRVIGNMINNPLKKIDFIKSKNRASNRCCIVCLSN